MRWFVFLILACLGLVGSAQARMGPDSNYNIKVAAGGGGPFTGPLDIASGATACYSFRACSAALAGTRAVNVCNVGDAACADLSTNASTGNLVVTTIGGSDCTVVTCTVKIIYDQTTGNACNAATCDISQATIANRPTFIVSCVGGKPCARFAGGTTGNLNTANTFVPALAQTYSESIVAERTGAFTTQQGIVSTNGPGNAGWIGYNASVNAIFMYAGGSVPTATASDNAFHAIAGIFNGASSNLAIDGSSNTVSPGAGSINGSIFFGTDQSTTLTGNIAEVVVWPTDKSSSISALSSNQHAYFGF